MHMRRLQKVHSVYTSTIPAELVRWLKWRHGDYIVFQLSEDDDLVLRKLDPKEFPHLFRINRGEIQDG